MLGEDRLDHRSLGQRLARLGQVFAFRFEIIDMEPKDVAVLDGVSDRVGVKALLEKIFRRFHAGLSAFDLLLRGILIEDGRSRESKELGAREELLDSLVVLSELGPMAFVKDEGDTLVAEGLQLFFEALFAALFLLLVALAVLV